jgi:hypothetical protein
VAWNGAGRLSGRFLDLADRVRRLDPPGRRDPRGYGGQRRNWRGRLRRFRYKDYRRDEAARYGTMTLATDEFIRSFLLHVLPKGFHRIRHYGLLASAGRKTNVARARQLLAVPPEVERTEPVEPIDARPPCPCCGGRMIIIETFQRWTQPRAPPASSEPTGSMTS